ncbi:MAG TPA: AAA family ATPase [Tissierellia bacterium]|nr:AAA family ATPase [Tissierellia bacterium]
MKPINLKIKGLNSFIETQEVDFKRLTQRGLFGIFGPTGSGKSTILDGITLALYGEIARKSTNFMNTNCNSMFVSYEFQITDKEVKRYRVDREFYRDKKTGKVRTNSAILVDITAGEQVLEDGVRSVTQRCEEIIGLNLEDFTRTVVLPQGKFSEFLKLEGKERREMLERLFNLQKYGDELSFKLALKIKEENEKANILLGELKTYEDISEEVQNQKTEELDNTKKELENSKNELKVAEETYNNAKELWELQKELIEIKNKEKSLREMEEEINSDKEKITLGESALKVWPYVENYENTLKETTAVKLEIEKLKEKLKIAEEMKNKSLEEFKQAKIKKDREIPVLKVKEQQIKEALNEKRALNILINEKNTLYGNIKTIYERLKNVKKDIETKEKNIYSLNESINIKEGKVESLKISEEFKNKVYEGFLLLKEKESITKDKTKIDNSIKSTLNNINESKKLSEILSKSLNNKEEELSKAVNQLKDLNSNCPGDQDTLLSMNKLLTEIKEKWNKYNEYIASIKKSKIDIEKLSEELKKREKFKDQLKDSLTSLKEKINNCERENLAHTLRENLKEGEVCPVCGSLDHHKENIISAELSDNLQELREEYNYVEEKFTAITGEIIQIQERLNREENNLEENTRKVKELGSDFKTYSVEELEKEFNHKYESINKYKEEKNNLEEKIRILTEEKNHMLLKYSETNSRYEHNKEQLQKLQEDLIAKNKDLKETEEKLILLKEEISVEDFLSVREEINRKEKERTLLEKEIKNHRENLKNEQVQKESLSEEYNNLNIQLKEKKTLYEEKLKLIEEKQENIISKVGTIEGLELLKDKVTNTILDIESSLEDAEKKKEEREKEFNNINNKILSCQGNLLSLQDRIIKDKEKLNQALKEEKIDSIEDVKNYYIPKEEIKKLKVKVENYNNSLAKIEGELRNLNKKINNRTLTEEEWQNIQREKEVKEEKLQHLQKLIAGLEVELKTIKEKLSVKKELLKQKQALDYKMALLSDLEKLFRGKKFVEFVAANQLKYVSMEASKILKDITGGTYGLEVDENGKFLIRDYKNGGAERDASTLSGGETFVASLALALALSSQIQLKGTAPLELFFLDEGFGTLDDNLLDVVMDSLEKIHHDRLSVGIISHVESIKNRVPVKLIVKPAEAGLGGSKVKIEVS